MSKVKSPLCSLQADGKLGDTLSFLTRKREHIVKRKTVPGYRLTLSQQYQRWLYEDYVYRWHQQTAAVKEQYSVWGKPYNLNGFQYWIKFHLTYLSDIAAWWRMDSRSAAVSIDSSKNGNHATIYGAIPVTAVIESGESFDGLNDNLIVSAPLNNIPAGEDARTVEGFIYPVARGDDMVILDYGGFFPMPGFIILFRDSDYYLELLTPSGSSNSNTAVALQTWSHFACVLIPPNTVKWYIAGDEVADNYSGADFSTGTGTDLAIGSSLLSWNWWKGRLDNLIFWNRSLDATEILRHSQRRYPS